MREELLGYLKTRRSIPAALMTGPAPGPAELQAMLAIAARVPDHGKLAPWRFVVYSGAQLAEAAAGLGRIAATASDEKERRYRAEKAAGFAAAPLVVGVISAPVLDHPKIPLWEQQLSAGSVCLNLIHAAQAHGYAAQWLTGWFAYHEEAARWLGVRDGERVAGFIHIGVPAAPPTERDRPDLAALTTQWQPDAEGDRSGS